MGRLALAGACCLILAACGSGGTSGGAGSGGTTTDGGTGSGGGGGGGACTPTTCAAQGKNCGSLADGCGAMLDCGACAGGLSCGGAGVANVCGSTGPTCVPTTCSAQHKNCGNLSDGCGAMLDCGACGASLICGGAGVANVCGAPACVPLSCAAQGKTCGAVSDGCGGTLQCGTCSEAASCSASNVCQPLPASTTVWSRGFAGYSMVDGNNVASDASGNTVALLHTQNGGVLVKVDRRGALLWQVPGVDAGGNGGFASYRSLAVSPAGQIYVTSLHGVLRSWNPDGTTAWSMTVPADFVTIAADSRGFVDVKGSTGGTPENETNALVERRDASGVLVWSNAVASSGNIQPFAVSIDPSGDVIVGGRALGVVTFNGGTHTHGRPGVGSPFLARMSGADGTFVWADVLEAEGDNSHALMLDVGTSAAGTVVGLGFDTMGTYDFAGSSVGGASGNGGFLAVAEHDGTPRVLRNTGEATPRAMTVDPSGSAYVAVGNSNCTSNVTLQKWRLDGVPQWIRTLDGTNCSDNYAFFSGLGWMGSGPVVGGNFGGSVNFGDQTWNASGGLSAMLFRLVP